MSTGIITPLQPPPETPVAPPTECAVVIQQRLQKTQRHVKGIDIAGGLIVLAIGVLAYLLAAAAIDHWLIVGGLGFSGRLWLWLVLLATAGTYFARRVLPPLLHRINPIFAAATIEKSQPSLKNSLINFLLLRGRRQEVAPLVYQAMEHRAAADLSNVEIDVAVDRTHVIRLGYVLAGVVAVFSLYLVLSPKSPIRSAARVLWPWSSIEAPTRVTIHDIQPGDATAFHGDFVTVSAEVAGLREGEPALVIYSTADGQTVDQVIPMTRPEGDYRYQCRLPPGNLGLQQDHRYYLAAGDCRTRRYRIEVRIAPTIVVDKVSYHYPAYTGMADQTVQRQGDLRAIEGTEVAIHATANGEIKPGTAEIDLGCTGQQGLRMSADGRTAAGRFTLRLNPKDASRPEYDSYQLRFADVQGRENKRPIRHRVEVIRDLPPEVRLVEPQQEEVQVAVDGKLTIEVLAEDPDFALRRVTLRAEHDQRSLPIAPLLEKRKPERAWLGEFSATYTFEPARLGLKAGDRVEYWVEAEDNKEPAPGRAASGKQWISVVRADAHKAATGGRDGETASGGRDDDKAATGGRAESSGDATGDKPPSGEGQSDQRQPESAEQPKAAAQSDPAQPGQSTDKEGAGESGQNAGQQQGKEQSPDQQQVAQTSEKSNERIDPDTDPGDAMQEILNDRQKKQEQSKENQSNSDNQPSQKQQSGEQQQTGEQAGGEKAGGEKAGGEKVGVEKAGGEKAGDEKAGGEKAGDEKVGGEKAGGEKAGGEKAGGEKAGGEKAGDEKAGGEKAGAEEGGGAKSGQEKPDADTTGGEKSGSEAGGKQQEQSADEQSSSQQSGKQQPDRQESSGAGKKTDDGAASPAPQSDNLSRPKQPGQAGEAPGERKGNEAQSPGISKKQSDSQGETAGDRSGGGEQGGGQQANKPGTGGPGSHAPANEGGSQTNEQGEGEIGSRPGDQAASKQPAGSAVKKQMDGSASGDRTEQKAATDGRAGEATDGDRTGRSEKKPDGQGKGEKPPAEDNSAERGTPQENPTDGGTPGKGTSERPNASGSGSPTVGGKPGARPDAAASPEPIESSADQANLEYARRQSELALEHLRDQLAKEKPELLERLGWSKDDARRFVERWEQMRQAAAQEGPEGKTARKHLDNALRSLGLRPRGAELRHGGIAAEQPQNLRDAGRFAPPPDWAEQFREYTRGVAGGERKNEK